MPRNPSLHKKISCWNIIYWFVVFFSLLWQRFAAFSYFFLATGACAEHGTAWEFPHLLWWESPWRSRRSRDTTAWETGGFQADTCLPVSWQIPILCMRGPYPSPVLLILLEMHGEAKLCETILLRSWLINAHYRSMFSPWGLISGFAMRLSCEMRIS